MHGPKPRVSVIVLAAAAMALPAPGAAPAAACRDRAPSSWDIEVAPAGEPGERLVVSGRVLSRRSHAPVAGVTVYVYHADATGNYNRAGHENEEPRLCGVLRTNARGEYRLRTSMPGGYGGAPPHIHFEVWGPRLPRQVLFVNLVRETVTMDTSRALPAPGLLARRPELTAWTRPVVRGEGGVLRCRWDLLVGAR